MITRIMDENTNMQSTPAPASGGKKTLIYVGVGILALAVLGGFASRMMGGAAMRAAGVDINQNGSGATTYSNNEGTVTVGAGAMPENWPADAPQNYSGATIQYSGASNPQTGKAGSAVVYMVKATAQGVIDYYKQQLGSNGWTIESTANAGGAMVLAAKKDTRTLGVYVVDAGNGSVTVTAGIGQ